MNDVHFSLTLHQYSIYFLLHSSAYSCKPKIPDYLVNVTHGLHMAYLFKSLKKLILMKFFFINYHIEVLTWCHNLFVYNQALAQGLRSAHMSKKKISVTFDCRISVDRRSLTDEITEKMTDADTSQGMKEQKKNSKCNRARTRTLRIKIKDRS